MDANTSISMALASLTDPAFPSIGISRVLLLPGIGHLATTTIDIIILLARYYFLYLFWLLTVTSLL
jgi:hypothetical protein